MLQIQRASAGSGKTYTLTRKFIIHLITIKDDKGELTLRTPKQVDDALPKILAITFTNKATNEMKTRIVEKLAALSLASEKKNLTPDFINHTDYLKELGEILQSDYTSIGKICKYALINLLNNYSLFHISTIDAFFQEILRTFAYEVNLNDSYQLEIDTELISSTALDSTLNDFEKESGNTDIAGYWLRILMKREARKSQQWNVFSKSQSQKSIYSNIKAALKRLESEEYKIHKKDLEKYFNDPEAAQQVKRFYIHLKTEGITERNNALKEIKDLSNEISQLLTGEKDVEEIFYSNFFKHIKAAKVLKPDDKFPYTVETQYGKGTVTKSKKNSSFTNVIDNKTMMLYNKILDWDNPQNFTKYYDWKIYGELLPYFGLILEVSKRLSEIMRDENIIRLSDTSSLLKKIIGDDDTPFVYEKLGTFIDSYLIDEFQDTSRMQWSILYPLILEGEANKDESLIIGDPKQSIYRFRNADHRLITDVVPKAFPNHITSGLDKKGNTNWRSKQNIVEFNNFFFHAAVDLITRQSKEKGEGTDFMELYSNVVQYPANQTEEGYIEIQFFNKSDNEDSDSDSDDESGGWFDKAVLKNIGPLISKLIARGYRQKDIGILVNKNTQGTSIIDQLVKYNQSLPSGQPKIEFLSEESLLISSSRAVENIISVIERIADIGRNKEFLSKAVSKLNDGNIPNILKNNVTEEKLQSLMNSLETPSITTLIESIVCNCLPEELKDSDAIYISALQDAVNENSMQFSGDPASFMEWWNKKGKLFSVNSPEDTDAIQIMTVHKSKGLEFKCVILPFAAESFMPSHQKEEWKWVKPSMSSDFDNIPPLLPIKPSTALMSTPYEHLYREYVDQVMTDKLNSYYVAFTRAKNELYVFSKLNNGNSMAIQDLLYKICTNPIEYSDSEAEWTISPGKISWDKENMVIRAGAPLTSDEIEKEYQKNRDNEDVENKILTREISSYNVYDSHPKLKFKIGNASDFED